jgi:hypothetical protein
MPNCHICNLAKDKLKSRNIPFTEIKVMDNEKNMQLAKEYNVKMAGTIIDTETGFTIDFDGYDFSKIISETKNNSK